MLSIPEQSKQWIKQVEKPQSISDEIYISFSARQRYSKGNIDRRREIFGVYRMERVENEIRRKFIK